MTALGMEQLGGELSDLAELTVLSPPVLLDLVEESVVARRAVEVRDLLLVAAWAEMHAVDPRRDAESGRRVWAEDRLVFPGGEGTPGVQEFSLGALATSRVVGVTACERDVADVQDLMYRLPRVWAATRELTCPVWLARKVARLSRRLPSDRVGVVDVAVAAAIVGQAPGRVLAICEAKVIEADPGAHAERVQAERRRRYVRLSRTDECGLRHLIARVSAGDAVWIDATLERVADLIADRHPGAGRDELRSVGLGWLARPAELLQLLLEGQAEDQAESPEPSYAEVSRATAFPADLLAVLAAADPQRFRPKVVLYVHLSEVALAGHSAPVARVEQVGAMLADHDLFVGCQVICKPVVDLNDRVDLNCYEHPWWLAEQRKLATPSDYFPYAAPVPGLAGQADLDHPRPYDPLGPPGQTGMHNSGPLGRRHHRWKTHAGFRARQCGTSRWVWRTPHRRYFLVDHRGTHRLDEKEGAMIFDAPDGVEIYVPTISLQAWPSSRPRTRSS
jgi:hypothetical protein